MDGPRAATRRLVAAVCLAAIPGVARAEPVALPDDLHLSPPGPARSAADHPLLGAWAGDAWGGVLPHVPVVERVASDGYYPASAIRGYFAAFEQAGGHGRLVLFGGLPGDGHRLVDFVPVWKPEADRSLRSLGP